MLIAGLLALVPAHIARAGTITADATQIQSKDPSSITITALGAAKSSLLDTGALLKVTVPYPLKVIVWRSESEGQLAMQSRGSAFDSRVLTGGQRVAPDLIFVFSPVVDVIRHETAHAVS